MLYSVGLDESAHGAHVNLIFKDCPGCDVGLCLNRDIIAHYDIGLNTTEVGD